MRLHNEKQKFKLGLQTDVANTQASTLFKLPTKGNIKLQRNQGKRKGGFLFIIQ